MSIQTVLESHGEIDSVASEVYGQGPTLLRIGNGGAGATGLIAALANDYLATRRVGGSIAWVCNHSRNTQLALLHDYIDLALTYERDQEKLASSEGWATPAQCAFVDHFCLAGPSNDPTGIVKATSIGQALSLIARAGNLFHSRADHSATMFKERYLWSSMDLSPWTTDDASTWYHASLKSPADALVAAVKQGAYLLTDRSTLLRQTQLGNVTGFTVFFEPTSSEDVLINACYSAYSPKVQGTTAQGINAFLGYLHSSRGQRVVEQYGEREVGLPFFASREQGFARSSLVGGHAKGHRRYCHGATLTGKAEL